MQDVLHSLPTPGLLPTIGFGLKTKVHFQTKEYTKILNIYAKELEISQLPDSSRHFRQD
jgi:hypothetical protein